MDEQAAREFLEQALQERTKTQALVAAAKEKDDEARLYLYEVIRKVIRPRGPLRQVDITRMTGWSREHIRQITHGKQT